MLEIREKWFTDGFFLFKKMFFREFHVILVAMVVLLAIQCSLTNLPLSLTFHHPHHPHHHHSSFIQAAKIDYHQVLDDYMKQPTPSYSYQYLYQYTNSYATIHVLNMTSVFWLTSKEIGRRHEWFHYIEIAIPHSLDKNKKEGLLMITGGSQQSSPPRGDSELSIMSFLTQSICSAIHQIPNQPIVFESGMILSFSLSIL